MTKRASDVKYTGGTNEAGASRQSCAEHQALAGDRPVRIRAAIFFDGTLNNRTNTLLGEDGIHKGTSYENAQTNIAILEKYYSRDENYDYSFSIYVEGVGTEDDETDRILTAALGTGATGILDKVEVGTSKIVKGIVNRYNRNQQIDCVHIDSFGFSRGAAAARNFIYTATVDDKNNLKQRLALSGRCVDEVKIKFIGLFDTVASYGLNHQNDTLELRLDAVSHAENVVQLAAADEHRKNFPLTNIASAPHGLEYFLPGSHSDIGGGYVDNLDEINLFIMSLNRRNGLTSPEKAAFERQRRWLLKAGWYFEDEIEDVSSWHTLKVTRRSISSHYSRIPLKLMADIAGEKGVAFLPELFTANPIPPALEEIEAVVLKSRVPSPDYWLNSTDRLMMKLRHDYLHFSAYYGSALGCNDPQFTHDDPIHGYRKRKIYNG